MALTTLPLGDIDINGLRQPATLTAQDVLTAMVNANGDPVTDLARSLGKHLKNNAVKRQTVVPNATESLLKTIIVLAASGDAFAAGLFEGICGLVTKAADATINPKMPAKAADRVRDKAAQEVQRLTEALKAIRLAVAPPPWAAGVLHQMIKQAGEQKAKGRKGQKRGRKTEADAVAALGDGVVCNLHVLDADIAAGKGTKLELDAVRNGTLFEIKARKLTADDVRKATSAACRLTPETLVREGKAGEPRPLGTAIKRLAYVLGEAPANGVLGSFAGNTRQVIKSRALAAAVEAGRVPEALDADGTVTVPVPEAVAEPLVASLCALERDVRAWVGIGALSFYSF
jgi:hypothetical protein